MKIFVNCWVMVTSHWMRILHRFVVQHTQLTTFLVEDNPNFEKVIINIVTDGQISPVDAFKNALDVMYAQMAVFNSEVSIKSANPTVERNEEHPELKRLGARIEELGLSARSFNCLGSFKHQIHW